MPANTIAAPVLRSAVSALWKQPAAHTIPTLATIALDTDTTVSTDSNIWITSLPRGAYSSARTVGMTHILEFSSHVGRTASSLAQMVSSSSNGSDRKEPLAWPATDPAHLATVLRPLAAAALAQYYKSNNLHVPPNPISSNPNGISGGRGSPNDSACEETKVTWLVSTDAATVAVHCAPLHAPGVGEHSALVAGAPRALAGAKDSQWVHDRAALASVLATGGYNEVLLASPAEAPARVYEGLSSNAFALVSTDSGVELHTAPLEDVLTGTILKIVLDVAREMQLPVVFAHPDASVEGCKRWVAAFVTSTSRLVCPLARIDFAPVAGSPTTRPSFKLDAHHPIVEEIVRRVDAEVWKRALLIME
ncbi:hypothetical protein BC828DRAFT_372749 [Blastocladiella britannica]|nr:hypothetical protein BC828DRAFT_372749 [Blastocladiella britannica]